MNNLPKLNFETKFEFRIKREKNTFYIFDLLENQWLVLSPEEWVRQHWVHYFHFVKSIATSSLIKEKKIELNSVVKRIDLLVTEKTLPKILLEFKAPNIKLTESVFEQIARYNTVINAPEIILSNGLRHIFAKFSEGKYFFKNQQTA